MEDITNSLLATSDILPHQLSRRLRKYKINFLQCFILCLWHKENLVEPSHHRDPAIESESQPGPSHGGLHSAEIVGHDEAAEEERCIRSGHAVRTQIGGVDFCGNDPGETCVGAEESHVQDQPGEIHSLCSRKVGQRDMIASAYNDEAHEETWEHSYGPESAPACFHEKDGGDGAKEKSSAADEGHVVAVCRVEADLIHEDGHVVHDCVHAGKLTEKDHDVGIDEGAAAAWHSILIVRSIVSCPCDQILPNKIHPGESASCFLRHFTFLLLNRCFHDKELLLRLNGINASNAFPNFVRLQRLALVHEETGTFWHE
jgi:hypothetical protein